MFDKFRDRIDDGIRFVCLRAWNLIISLGINCKFCKCYQFHYNNINFFSEHFVMKVYTSLKNNEEVIFDGPDTCYHECYVGSTLDSFLEDLQRECSINVFCIQEAKNHSRIPGKIRVCWDYEKC